MLGAHTHHQRRPHQAGRHRVGISLSHHGAEATDAHAQLPAGRKRLCW
jgi:hypothetical protein